jgi:hypothetical protein
MIHNEDEYKRRRMHYMLDEMYQSLYGILVSKIIAE